MKDLLTKLFTYDYGQEDDPQGIKRLSVLSSKQYDEGDMTNYDFHLQFYRTKEEDNKYEFDILIQVPNDDNALVKADGKSRVQITSAKNKPVMMFYGNSIFKIRYPSFYFNLNETLTLGYSNSYDNPEHKINSYSILKYFGLLEKYDNNVNPNDVPDLTSDEIMYITQYEIPETVRTKIEVISRGKYTFTTPKVTKEFVSFVVDIINEKKQEDYNIPTPLDYEYLNAIDALKVEIRNNWSAIRDDMRYRLNRWNKFTATALQNVINRYFKMQAKDFRDIQSPKDSNAVTMMSQGKRLYFYDRDKETRDSYGNYVGDYYKVRMYNNYFRGVLDPVKTADGPNINMTNEMTNATSIKDKVMYIKLYDMNFNEVNVPYEKYIKSKILSADNVDWTSKKIIKNKNGKYDYMQYSVYYSTDNLKDIEYIRSYDNLLSPATACIPFLNRMVGTRSLLSSHFLDQSIPVVGARPSIVHTPATKKYYKESPYNVKSPCDGTVVEILDSLVKIERDDKTTIIVGDDNSYTNTANHTTNIFSPIVKVGDRVKEGDIVIAMNSFVDGEFTTQVPLFTLYGTYEGHEHEDGIIITESAAKKFAHVSIEDVGPYLTWDRWYRFDKVKDSERFDEWGLIKVGQKIKRGDTLFSYRATSDAIYNSIADAVDGTQYAYEPQVVRAPYDIEDGEVISANIYINNSDVNNKEFEDYYNDRLAKENAEYEMFTGTQKPGLEFNTGVMYAVVIKVKFLNTMDFKRLSGKLSNFYASKGVNTYIIPDEEALEVTLPNGGKKKVECIIQPTTTYSRQNPGQIDEVKLGLVGIEGWKWLQNNIDKNPEKVTEFLKELYPNGYDMEQIKSDGEKYGYLRITVSPFDKYYSNERIKSILSKIGLENNEFKVYNPKTGRETNQFNTVGVTSMMRLHFLQEKKAKATSDTSFDTANDVLAYEGVGKEEGQKTGGQEIWAHWGHGDQDIVQKITDSDPTKGDRFAATLLMLCMRIK